MNTVRFGLVGYGRFGAQHAKAITTADGAALTAIAAHSEDSCSRAAADYPSAAVVSDYRELVKRDDVDVVSVVVPTYLHYDVGKAALEAGKHLFIEKPMARTVEECRELVSLAEERKLSLCVGFKRRVAPIWRTVKEMVNDGAIGTPRYALIDLWRWPYRLGSGGWRYDPARVGSWILEEPVHAFDKARWYLAQCGEPDSVYAVGSSNSEERSALADNFSAIVRFEDGAHVTVTQTLSAFGHRHRVGITGTNGAILATWEGARDSDSQPRSSLEYRPRDGEEIQDIDLPPAGGEVEELREEVHAMVAAVAEGAPVPAGGTDGAWAVALCVAAEESVKTGELVRTARYRP